MLSSTSGRSSNQVGLGKLLSNHVAVKNRWNVDILTAKVFITRKNVAFSATQNVQEISHFLYISFSRIVEVLVMILMYSVGQLSSTISCTAEMWHVGNISCKVHYIWNVLYISCSTNIYYVLIFLLGYSPVPKTVNISDTSITTNVATYRHV